MNHTFRKGDLVQWKSREQPYPWKRALITQTHYKTRSYTIRDLETGKYHLVFFTSLRESWR